MQHQPSDIPIRIKNGYMAKKPLILVNKAKMSLVILKILQAEGYIGDFKEKTDGNKTVVEVALKYKNHQPALTGVKIISKPGRRLYYTARMIKPILGGMGTALISTPQGVLTDKQAREKKIGGEVLFYIW